METLVWLYPSSSSCSSLSFLVDDTVLCTYIDIYIYMCLHIYIYIYKAQSLVVCVHVYILFVCLLLCGNNYYSLKLTMYHLLVVVSSNSICC